MFAAIKLKRWRQFNKVNIYLNRRMTVLTGENGTGKTTILNILSKHFGWNLKLVSTPLPISKRMAKQIWTDAWDTRLSDFDVKPEDVEIGTIKYKNGQICRIMVPPHPGGAQYNLKYTGQQTVYGLHIPPYQPAWTYHQIQDIPTSPKTSQQQYQDYQTLLVQQYQASPAQSPGLILKKSLISLAAFGYGSKVMTENPEYIRIFLPKVLGFIKLEIRMPDIVFITETGNFPLDAASGGIGAIVGLAWQIFMYGQDKQRFVVTIDEPETHLHPSMQRELLPNLLRAFPNTQFIIATHSPFIAASSQKARVYALVANEDRHIDSLHLKTVELSGTANETLREILGVPISVPIWVEEKLNKILVKYENRDLSLSLLEEFKKELSESNLDFLAPDVVKSLERKDA
ncbi:hypothetical protein ES703_83673 [subsurface metagenome]